MNKQADTIRTEPLPCKYIEIQIHLHIQHRNTNKDINMDTNTDTNMDINTDTNTEYMNRVEQTS